MVISGDQPRPLHFPQPTVTRRTKRFADVDEAVVLMNEHEHENLFRILDRH